MTPQYESWNNNTPSLAISLKSLVNSFVLNFYLALQIFLSLTTISNNCKRLSVICSPAFLTSIYPTYHLNRPNKNLDMVLTKKPSDLWHFNLNLGEQWLSIRNVGHYYYLRRIFLLTPDQQSWANRTFQTVVALLKLCF